MYQGAGGGRWNGPPRGGPGPGPLGHPAAGPMPPTAYPNGGYGAAGGHVMPFGAGAHGVGGFAPHGLPGMGPGVLGPPGGPAAPWAPMGAAPGHQDAQITQWGQPTVLHDPDELVKDTMRSLPREELAREIEAALLPGDIPRGANSSAAGVKTVAAKLGRRIAAGIKSSHCVCHDALAVGTELPAPGAAGHDDPLAACRDVGWDELVGEDDASLDTEEFLAARERALKAAGIA